MLQSAWLQHPSVYLNSLEEEEEDQTVRASGRLTDGLNGDVDI